MSDHYIMFVYYKLLVYLCASHQIITDFCNYNLTDSTRSQKKSTAVWFIHPVWKNGEQKKKKKGKRAAARRDSRTVFSSIYEVSWWVIKRKGQGECVFIRSKPIGHISTFHATTLWLQLLPFCLKQYIHLGHSHIISPILHLIGNVTQRAERYYRIDLLPGLVRSLRYDINGV